MSKKSVKSSAKRAAEKASASEPKKKLKAAVECEPEKVGNIEYVHQLKKGKVTDEEELQDQVDGQIAAMNKIIEEEGMAGLKKRIRDYRKSDEVEKAGRQYIKDNLEPAGEDEDGNPLAWLHEPDMATGGKPTDVTRKGKRRNNSILGGQANKIADSILAMPNDTTKIEAKLTILPAE
ncbi:MAG: polymorphic toxin type 15 domain-containing protein [Acidobacteriota bacterium]